MTRHLVLDTGEARPTPPMVGIACLNEPALYNPADHTYLTRLATCPECLAVHAAWHIMFCADLEGR